MKAWIFTTSSSFSLPLKSGMPKKEKIRVVVISAKRNTTRMSDALQQTEKNQIVWVGDGIISLSLMLSPAYCNAEIYRLKR